jgi:cellulose synthase/poly-beta-1,6-N-acetylglucosamine synthase-like glycosyltransferase
MIQDPLIAVLQTPQYFRVRPEQTWVEKGAGAVQEFFYRIIQNKRDRFGGAICVGTSAMYRREALEAFGGSVMIEHSEDVHTGFNCLIAGYKIKYVPVILSMGISPYDMASFFNQQYRWASGSATLLLNKEFWTSNLTFIQKLCYLSGMLYYSSYGLGLIINAFPTMALYVSLFLSPG